MPLESTIVCLDVSQWMLNGDYAPTRIDAQYDAGNITLLTSPTEDLGKLLASLHGLRPGGTSNLVGAIKTAMIALKHRKNKLGSQRIITFVGSPVDGPKDEDLRKLGAVLKKNNIALDVVSIGEPEFNTSKLQVLVDAANNSENSHLLSIPAGLLPSDVLASSPIMGDYGGGGGGGGGAAPGAAAAGAGGSTGPRFQEYGGVDPAMDPELAMVMRISMEEARVAAEARDAAAGGAASSLPLPEGTPVSAAVQSTPAPANGTTATVPDSAAAAGAGSTFASPPPSRPAAVAEAAFDEDDLLQQALMLSMAEAAGGSSGATSADEVMSGITQPAFSTPAAAAAAAPAAGAAAPTPAAATAADSTAPAAAGGGGGFSDMSFVESLLGGLPGVDINDPAIQEAMRALQAGQPPQPPPNNNNNTGGGSSGGSQPPPK